MSVNGSRNYSHQHYSVNSLVCEIKPITSSKNQLHMQPGHLSMQGASPTPQKMKRAAGVGVGWGGGDASVTPSLIVSSASTTQHTNQLFFFSFRLQWEVQVKLFPSPPPLFTSFLPVTSRWFIPVTFYWLLGLLLLLLCVHVCMRACVRVSMHVCTYACMWMCVCVCVNVHVCLCVCVWVCMRERERERERESTESPL